MSQILPDRSGERHGGLTVIRRVGKRGRHALWLCVCDCGEECILCPSNFKNTKSCGCKKSEFLSKSHTKDLLGRQFGLWKVIERDNLPKKFGNVKWICECKCGERRSVAGSCLVGGKSSGCNSCRLRGVHRLNLAGIQIGPWVPMSPVESSSSGTSWLCLHADGRQVVVSATTLRELRNPLNKLARRYRKRVHCAFKERSVRKEGASFELLGCSGECLAGYLSSKFTPGMTLENHGKWHIDHIRPIASFDLTDPEQALACFHYTNLRPLWAKDNLSKGSKFTGSV